MRAPGGGRKSLYSEMEGELHDWIIAQRRLKLRVSRRKIKDKAAEMCRVPSFTASNGWLYRFLIKKNLSRRKRTTVCQKLPEEFAQKIARYVLFVRYLRMKNQYQMHDIYAANETAVWLDAVSNDTIDTVGVKEVGIKTTGHEKNKITVLLTASPTRKVKPFVLINRVRPIKALDRFKSKLIICYSGKKTSMDDKLTEEYLKRSFGTTLFGRRRLLCWDSYRCHISESTKKVMKKLAMDMAVVPGGTTKYLQAPDVSWNKDFKKVLVDEYDKFMSDESQHSFTKGGNMRGPGFATVCDWIVKAWEELKMDTIEKSFKICAITGNLDGSEDGDVNLASRIHPVVHSIHPGKR